MKKGNHARLHLLSIVVIIVGLGLLARLFFIQIVKGAELNSVAQAQNIGGGTRAYDRGGIFFSSKDGSLLAAATLKSGHIAAINPRVLKDATSTYERIKELVQIDKQTFMARSSKDDPYEEIGVRLSDGVGAKIRALDIDGLQTYDQRWRYYPGSNLASHVVGFAGFKGDKHQGLYGIEREYDDLLERDNTRQGENLFTSMFAGLGKIVFSEETREADIVLTIEPKVQAYTEAILTDLEDKWSTKELGAIVIKPQTGDIIAMAALPNFDPNNYNKVDKVATFTNPLVERVYELGSIMKPITVAAGLDSGKITPQTRYYDEGMIEIDDYTISNYDGKGRGWVDMQEVLGQSLNTGTMEIVKLMGNQDFKKYVERFGLGEMTGIDLPNDQAGLVGNLENGRDVEYATASFGQGIAISPLAMTRALSAIANGGYLIKPHVTREIRYLDGTTNVIPTVDQAKVISRDTSDEVTRMLVKVTDQYLAGGTVYKPRYSIATKTGTAQIADKLDGGYYDDRYMHSFFGYFPAYDPEFLIFLYLKEPVGARYASHTLSAPFMDITDFLISYYQIPPDR